MTITLIDYILSLENPKRLDTKREDVVAKTNRIDNETLLRAGLELMQRNGKPLTKRASKGRAMLYELPNGETVRARTSNDHILIVVAETPAQDARLNIEGTEWLLIVMPENERTHGKVVGYLVPTQEAVDEARRSHAEWLASNPNTHGGNTTWNLWFNDGGPEVASGYSVKWAKYRIEGEVKTLQVASENTQVSEPGSINAVVEAARTNIARVAGVLPRAVRITIDFGA